MIFIIFRDFSDFIFRFKTFKKNKKNAKKCLISERGHVDATWHSGPRGSATRAHAAYAFIYLCYIVYIYNGYSQPSVDWKGIRTI